MAIKRLYDTLVGATVNVNQLVDSNTSSAIIPTGHKYYAVIGGTASIGASTGTAISVAGGTDMLTDLTDYFGSTIADYIYSLESATAGAGIAKLREWGFFTEDYIPYNPGSLESVEARSHVMRGFNQWDEEWESGGISSADGSKYADANRIRSKNYIPVLPNTTYYFRLPLYSPWKVAFYDSDKVFISYRGAGQSSFTTPSNCHYLIIAENATDYGTTYKNDICINLSNPDRNGEYEPYHSQSYPLGSDVLRGIFKLDSSNNLYADGDRKEADGTITRRYGVVDLGTLTWAYSNGYFSTNINLDVPSVTQWQTQNGITPLYVVQPMFYVINPDNRVDKSIAWYNNCIRIADSAYNDATVFTTAMDGVMLVYELATPTTEQSTPFTSPQICDPDGTEEYTTNNGLPAGHETRYQL